jgi:flagellar motor switch protein FliM
MQDSNSVIHRKAKVAREEFDARGMSPAKALRLAIAKVADRSYNLPVVVNTVEQSTKQLADLKSEIQSDNLLLLLDGSGQPKAAVCLDLQCLAAMIEVQTTGSVRDGDVNPRSFTRTDASICAPFVEAVLEEMARLLEGVEADQTCTGFRYADMVGDARALTLALEAPRYDIYCLALSLGDGAKTGVFKFIAPCACNTKSETAGSGEQKVAGQGTLCEVAQNAPVTLDTILARIAMPLREACQLETGMVFPLSPRALETASLVATGGYVVARVALGQINGLRAVRLLGDRETVQSKQSDALSSKGGDSTAGDPHGVDAPEPGNTTLSLGDEGATAGSVQAELDEASEASGQYLSKVEM